MLVAAADPTADATLVLRAARALGVGRDAAAAAADAELLEIGSDVRFRHPLVRSASYAIATPEDRSAAHLALAAATDPERDPERRVWHRAAAATGFDEEVASELERAAAAAQGRAGLAAAAAFLDRAAALTPDPGIASRPRAGGSGSPSPSRSVRRGAWAVGRRRIVGGRRPAAGARRAAQRPGRGGGRTRARRAGSTPPRREAARVARCATRRETYLQAWWAALLAGRVRAARPALGDLQRGACAPATRGPDTVRPAARRSRDADHRRATSRATRPAHGRSISSSRTGSPTTTGSSGVGARRLPPFALWDFESWIELSTRQVDRARASGALTSLVLSLNFHANMLAYCGDLEGAAAVVAEQEAAREATGIRIVSYGARLVAAHQGHRAEMSAQTAAIEDELMSSSDGYALQVATLATALLNNGLGRYTEAIAAAQELSDGVHVPRAHSRSPN